MAKIILNKNRERSLLRKHPWIFSGAIKKVEGAPKSGETVSVHSQDGQCLGLGAWSPASQIRVRLWTFDPDETINAAFFERRIREAAALRTSMGIDSETDAWRIISAECDGLPGLIVDKYADFLVCQFLSAGVEYWKSAILDALQSLPGVQGVFERSDAGVRKKEGLPQFKGLVRGEAPPEFVTITDQDMRFLVDVQNGHKTGFYLDQRINRHKVRAYARDKEVLNCFAYTGGFGIAALMGGASHVTNAEDVAGLINIIEQNIELNGLDNSRVTNLKADVFQLLRQYENEGKQFDLIVLDPPKFAESQSQLMRASRGYKDINRLAFKLLRSGGLLFTFSCSGIIKPELFQKIVADAAIDAGSEVRIIEWLTQSPDHPVKLHIPESWYLKGLVVQVAY